MVVLEGGEGWRGEDMGKGVEEMWGRYGERGGRGLGGPVKVGDGTWVAVSNQHSCYLTLRIFHPYPPVQRLTAAVLSPQRPSAGGCCRGPALPPSAPRQRVQSHSAARDRGVALQLAPGAVRRRLPQVRRGDVGVSRGSGLIERKLVVC